ncbi:ral guanine nucleotide dissociation stimulator-like isoform X2 [Rhincodon typus]|uniref:ral guanine nucleotide dissociation stimulator-like isoform X2 n=1 Tax=Rhincodon typus TaxID=259920 RepID=UPI00202ED671|nr:ral guanine nucleotide dissociation stimulator-like isoform X2 [Rhincodon typus]
MEEPSTSQKPLEKSLKSMDTTSSGVSSNSGAPSETYYYIPKPRRRAYSGSCWNTTRPRYNHQNGENCLIRVGLEEDKAKEFKTILVTNQDRVSEIFKKAMTVLKFEPERPQDFDLAQIIESKKVLILPDDANLYFAMNKKGNYDFILRDRYEYRPSSMKYPDSPKEDLHVYGSFSCKERTVSCDSIGSKTSVHY